MSVLFFVHHNPVCMYFGIGAVALGYALAFSGTQVAAMLTAHSDRTRQQAHVLRAVVAGFGWKDEAFAAMLGITPARLSRFWQGLDGLDVKRLWALPDTFQAEYDRARAAVRGARVYERSELLTIRHLAMQPRRRMLRMTAPRKVELA